MEKKIIRIIMALALIACVWATFAAVDAVLLSTSETYEEMAEEIDQRDIDTGNALNYAGDDTSYDSVYETQQTLEHPPGLKKK